MEFKSPNYYINLIKNNESINLLNNTNDSFVTIKLMLKSSYKIVYRLSK